MWVSGRGIQQSDDRYRLSGKTQANVIIAWWTASVIVWDATKKEEAVSQSR